VQSAAASRPARSTDQRAGYAHRDQQPAGRGHPRQGFLQILLPSGETGLYPGRNFSTTDQGQNRHEDGYTSSRDHVPQNITALTIGQDRLVQVTVDGNPQPQTIGQIELANFMNEGGLEAVATT